MGETASSKINNTKNKQVYFNLDDEDELELYKKACKMNFSKWVKKQLARDSKVINRNNRNIVGEERVDIDREIVKIQNEEIDSMMI